MEPYCASCVTVFTERHIPYMLSCNHLVCPNCLPDPNIPQSLCPICGSPSNKELTIPALDVLDVILSIRKQPHTDYQQPWETVNKVGVPCFGAVMYQQCPIYEKCGFNHDPGMLDSVRNQHFAKVTANGPPVLTEQGWLCRCGLNHQVEEPCDSCKMQFR